MTRPVVRLCLVMMACCGCVRTRGPELPASVRNAGKWEPLGGTHVRVSVQSLAGVPNSGLLLPEVSGDGRWIAYLQVAPGGEAYCDSLFTGKGLQGVSLSIRPARRGGLERLVCPSGACWPAWSPTGEQLAFIAYNRAGRCELGLHDLATGRTRRMAVGLNRLMMPAVSPSGGLVALVGSSPPGRSRLHVFDPATGRLAPGPAVGEGQRHLWPFWIDERTLVYLTCQDGEAPSGWLSRWTPASQAPPQRICRVGLWGSEPVGLEVFAGLGNPISPSGRRLACYDAAADTIVLVDLVAGKPLRLEGRPRAGCWMGDRWFVAATDEDLLLFAPYAGQRKRLKRGACVPRWADPQTNQLILCAGGTESWTFELLRMQLLSPKADPSAR